MPITGQRYDSPSQAKQSLRPSVRQTAETERNKNQNDQTILWLHDVRARYLKSNC